MENESSIVNKFNEYKDFIKDKQVEFVIKKTERIAYGVYLLGAFVPQKEVLNHDLKKTAHLLLKLVSRFSQTTGISATHVDMVHGHLQYLSSLLSLSYISGFVSGANIEVIKNEINYLHKHIEELSTKTASETNHMNIKTDMFVVGRAKNTKQNERIREVIKDKKQATDQKPSKMSFIKDRPKPVKQTINKVSDDSKEDREEKVIQVIRDKGVVSIKDISSVVFDVSEKTIQRTLQTLIDKGQVQKEGERRWAKYRLM